MHHCNHHHHTHHLSVDNKLSWAAGINIILTIAQIIAGVFSGSLALIADALHNLSDAAAMVLALVARKIGRRHADQKRTYGYKKVETLAAFTNFITLILIGLWLAYEAVTRFFMPQTVDGWIVVWVAGLAILINGATAWLTYKDSKNSQNIRAAFLHNLTDMFSSVGVVIAGVCILMFGWAWIDPLMTLIISAYVLWYAVKDLPKICNILIDGVPDEIDMSKITDEIQKIDGITDIHHIHIRHLSEHSYAFEAHIVSNGFFEHEVIKKAIKEKLHHLHIEHSTLEFEEEKCGETHCEIKAS
jgi:cobalt-zinc-cadmium efflux system protein